MSCDHDMRGLKHQTVKLSGTRAMEKRAQPKEEAASERAKITFAGKILIEAMPDLHHKAWCGGKRRSERQVMVGH